MDTLFRNRVITTVTSLTKVTAMNDYYVYVYIDPRNLQEFYFGKGRGSRKNAHLSDTSDSEKAKRIAAIKAAGLEPTIRVIARDLSEHDALLIEKTLLWKLGRHLTNQATGHYAKNFRPHDTLHVELDGFDYQRGIYYYNVGEGPCRDWDDYRQYGFISAGQGLSWRNAITGFNVGDIAVAYLKGRGFVGIAEILTKATRIANVEIDGVPMSDLDLTCQNMFSNSDSEDRSEYVCAVKWLRAVDRNGAHWKPKSGLYTTTHVRASLDGQPKTIEYIETCFDIDLREYAT